ncbi:MAG: arylamine N-acetyltransferase [Candidatus Krumholzibacteria bacterium]|nr:arylamine N-acetyltransferase [Candidatus Krumholzibacteria bacterium]
MKEAVTTDGGRTAAGLFMDHFGIPVWDPDLGMLSAVVSHFSRIPYENVTKIIRKFETGDPDRMLRDPVEVMRGFVEDRTGGTCFSLTWCLGSILSEAGFRCRPAMADMKRPNVHCALLVFLAERSYLVDPGYLLGEPVPLAGAPVSVSTSFGAVELRPRGEASWDLFTTAGGERKWRYRLRTTPVSKAAFFRYWRDSFSLPMMNSLQLTRLTERGHLYVRDHHLRFQGAGEKVNENIRSVLEQRIEAEFGIPGEITARAREHIERMRESWRTHAQARRRPVLR